MNCRLVVCRHGRTALAKSYALVLFFVVVFDAAADLLFTIHLRKPDTDENTRTKVNLIEEISQNKEREKGAKRVSGKENVLPYWFEQAWMLEAHSHINIDLSAKPICSPHDDSCPDTKPW